MAKPELTTRALLERPVKLRRLVDQLQFEVDQVEDAAREQPKLQLEAGRYRVQKIRAYNGAKLAHEQALASLKLKTRRFKDDKGKQKYSNESSVSNKSELNPVVIKARIAMDDAAAEEELGKVLTDCYRQRSHMLLVIAKIAASEVQSDLRHTHNRLAQDEVNKIRSKAKQRVQELEIEDEDED